MSSDRRELRGKVAAAALALVRTAVGRRWTVARDLADALQREAADLFRQEMALSADLKGQDQHQEMRFLDNQRQAYRQKAIDGLTAINERVGSFRRECAGMKRLTAGLEVTRVMGKMESARLTVIKDGLNELIDDLEAFQAAVTDGLKEIDINNQSIQNNVGRLVGMVNSRAL